ncbi:MAG TPA: DUF1343 domain-containing protein, partial [Chthonomonadales bacterium]|nr:DUF1343 domain-containing protein [Chthonomonadales bacterium]
MRFAPLVGKSIGIITNQTGVTGDGQSDLTLFRETPDVRLRAIFTPEHGLAGTAPAGVSVAGGSKRGVPVHSLYGTGRAPKKRWLAGLDILVYDIQDIGARSYTYISTLGYCMAAAGRSHIPFVVLDRPDPAGAARVEGSPPAAGFRSFVGRYPVSYLYGMTPGELAKMINAEGWAGARCNLTVVSMQGYPRSMQWADTGLRWIPTSPH